MAQTPNGNWFTRLCSKPARFLAFHRVYNFALWVIFGGALMGFCLARLPYLAINTTFKDSAGPGEWFWFQRAPYKAAMTIHLATILPAGILAVFQFVPKIRHKFILLHRVDGYIIIICILMTIGSVLILARRSFGGSLETQAGVYFLAFITTGAVFLAFYNIKKKQIDQHRNWMLRAWVYMGTIISMRIIMIIASVIVGKIRSYYAIIRCDELEFMDRDTYDSIYKVACKAVGPTGVVPVPAIWGADMTQANAAAAFRVSFGMSLWMALGIHVLGVEIYLYLTSAETNRLRQAAYEKQLKAGMKNPGSAGFTSDRIGDAHWEPMPTEETADLHIDRRKTVDTDEDIEGGQISPGQR